MDALDWIGGWGVRVAGQTFVCLALGIWMAARLRATPAQAHAVLLLALLAALGTPAASWAVQELDGGAFVGPPLATVYRTALEPRPVPVDRQGWIRAVLVTVWVVGATIRLGGLGVGYLRGRRLVRRAEPVGDERLLTALADARSALGLQCGPALRWSAEVPAPVMWGWGRTPVVLVPAEALDRAAEIDWAAVFIHELAHLRRRDHLVGLFADVMTAVLFWNPAVWVLRRQLAWASELACDDRVVAAGRSPIGLAHALLALRRAALFVRVSAPALLGGHAGLKARVRRLLQVADPPPQFGRIWVLAAVTLAVAIVFGLAVAQTRPGPSPVDAPLKPATARTDWPGH